MNAMNEALLDFLKTLKQHNLLENATNSGLVVYADDQFVNQQSMKMNFSDINITDKLVMFSNGQDVVDYFDSLLKDLDLSLTQGEE